MAEAYIYRLLMDCNPNLTILVMKVKVSPDFIIHV